MNHSQKQQLQQQLPRILDKRRQECETLGDAIVSKLVQNRWQKLADPPVQVVKPSERLVFLLKEGFRMANEETASATARREAFTEVKQILFEIDAQMMARDLPDEAEQQQSSPPSISSQKQPSHPVHQPVAQRPGAAAATTTATAVSKSTRTTNAPSRSTTRTSTAAVSQTSRTTASAAAKSASAVSHRTDFLPPPPAYTRRSPTIPTQQATPAYHNNSQRGGRPNSTTATRNEASLRVPRPVSQKTADTRSPLVAQQPHTLMDGRFVPAAAAQQEKAPRSNAPRSNATTTNSSAPAVQGRAAKAMKKPSSLQKMLTSSKIRPGVMSATFAPDNVYDKQPYYYACTISPRRDRLAVTWKVNPISEREAIQADVRLQQWHPFWEPVAHVAMGYTAPVQTVKPSSSLALTAARFQFDPRSGKHQVNGKVYTGIASIPGLEWGKKADTTADTPPKDKDVALLLRMLPVSLPQTRNRADCHLWPKGTFLEVGNVGQKLQPVSIAQRKQQRHELSEWKYLCKHVDLASFVTNPQKPVLVQMVTGDAEVYLYSVAVCQYRSPERVFDMLMGKGEGAMERLSRHASMEKAVQFAQGSMIVLAGDDDENDDEEDQGKLVFSLTCPISKQIMETPVRPKGCKHFQCFDLKNFLSLNKTVCGIRWRCGCCERFVSLSDLQFCGLTADLLREFKDSASTERDRVEFNASGDYRLLDERKRRYQNRSAGSAAAQGGEASKRQKSCQQEIVIL